VSNVERVYFGGAPFKELAEMESDVWDAIMAYEHAVPTMAVVGVLRLIEHRLLTEVHSNG
jgi:hypothetical protein